MRREGSGDGNRSDLKVVLPFFLQFFGRKKLNFLVCDHFIEPSFILLNPLSNCCHICWLGQRGFFDIWAYVLTALSADCIFMVIFLSQALKQMR